MLRTIGIILIVFFGVLPVALAFIFHKAGKHSEKTINQLRQSGHDDIADNMEEMRRRNNP